MKRFFALLFLLPLLAFAEGTEDVKVGTQTRNVLSPLTINFPGTTLDFTGATITGLSNILLQTNGTNNGSQTKLNLFAGSNITLADDGLGKITITSTAGGGGTVTSVAVSGANGIGVSGSPITTSGTIALSLGAITPSTVQIGTLANTPASNWIIAGRQSANNRPTLVLQRFTDTSPTGDFISLYDIGSTPAKLFNIDITGTVTAGVWNGTAIANANLANSAITIAGTSTSLGGSITLDTISGVSSNGFLKRTAANTWTNDNSTYLTGNQTITLSGDVTGSGATAITTTVANLPDLTTQAGALLVTNEAAPSTPASGKTKVYVDSTSKNIASKNDAGTVNHGVQSKSSVASNFLTAISDAGAVSAAQPTASDVGLGSVTNDAQTKAAVVPNTAPSSGQILVGNAGGTAYAPQTLSGSGATATLSSAGVLTLSAISNSTLSNSSITLNSGSSFGITAPGAMSLGSTYTIGSTSDNLDFATLLLGTLTNSPASNYVEAMRQSANNRPTLVLQRQTNTSPTGDFISAYDIASTPAKLFNVDITGTITAGTWHGSTIDNTYLTNSSITIGGASTSLGGTVTATTILDSISSTQGVVLYRGSSAWSGLATGSAGSLLRSGGSSANPSWTTPTYPNAASTSGKVLVSDGTNFVTSTPTFPNASATSRKIIVSDGTNWVASTETHATPGTSGNLMTSDGTNWNSTAPRSIIHTITGTIDGQGGTLNTGKFPGYFTVPGWATSTITAYSISADTGTCTVQTWKVAAGTAIPTSSNTISTSGVALSSGTHVRSTTTSDFTTTTITAGDIIAFNLSAVSSATQITFEIEVTE